MTSDEQGLPDSARYWRLSVLFLLAAGAMVLWLATPWLIKPYPLEVPWYASPALFPRFALAVIAFAAVWELVRHRRGARSDGSDELDADNVDAGLAVRVILAFAGYAGLVPVLGFLTSSLLFLVICARLVGLGWRANLMLAIPLALSIWGVFVHLLGVSFGRGLLP